MLVGLRLKFVALPLARSLARRRARGIRAGESVKKLTESTEGGAFLYLFSRFLFAGGLAVVAAAFGSEAGCGDSVSRCELIGLG